MTAGELLSLLPWLLCLIDTTQLKCQHVYLGVKTYNVKALVKTRACWWISVGDLGDVLLLAAVWTLDLTHNQENTHGWIGKKIIFKRGTSQPLTHAHSPWLPCQLYNHYSCTVDLQCIIQQRTWEKHGKNTQFHRSTCLFYLHGKSN